jgi:hypothetical protein
LKTKREREAREGEKGCGRESRARERKIDR